MIALARLAWRGYAWGQLAWSSPAFFARLWALPWYGGMLRAWIDGLGMAAGARVLEVGCSAGLLTGALAERGFATVGMDRSARAIRFASRAVGDWRWPPRFVIADAVRSPFDVATFDATIAASVVNIAAEPGRLLAEMARVTAAGGVVACLYPTPFMQPARARQMAETHGYRGFSEAALGLWAALARKLSPDRVAPWMQQSGLVDVRHQFLLDGMVAVTSGRQPAG